MGLLAHVDADTFQGNGKVEGFQTRAALDQVVADPGHGIRQVQRLQRDAVLERVLADLGDALTQRDLRERRALGKGPGADGLDGVGQHELFQGGLVVEGLAADGRHGMGVVRHAGHDHGAALAGPAGQRGGGVGGEFKGEFLHGGGESLKGNIVRQAVRLRVAAGQAPGGDVRAAGEGVVRDVSKAVRQIDARERRVAKGPRADKRHSFRQEHLVQRRIAVKGLLLDAGHRFRQGQRVRQRAGQHEARCQHEQTETEFDGAIHGACSFEGSGGRTGRERGGNGRADAAPRRGRRRWPFPGRAACRGMLNSLQ